jgi:hypothetical protein
MDALRGVVSDELGGWVVGVEFDLVDCWNDLAEVSGPVPSQAGVIRHTFVDGSFRRISKFLIPKLETPMFFTLPVAGSFCISCHVLMKFQSGRCFFRLLGSVDEGQCIRYKST